MKKPLIRRALPVVLASVILLSVGSAAAAVLIRSQVEDPLPDLSSLLNESEKVQIHDLVGEDRDAVIEDLMQRPEASRLRQALLEKGFVVALSHAEAMTVTVGARAIDVVVAPAPVARRLFLPMTMRGQGASRSSLVRSQPSSPPAEAHSSAPLTTSPQGSAAYLTAMVADNGTTLFQAHHTNLDPQLAESTAPPLVVNDMPYFYVTVIHLVDDQPVTWRYWWYDSHHHPDWYYACYRHYWDHYHRVGAPWADWYHWAYGWTYWRFWYYWSTWFPWAVWGP